VSGIRDAFRNRERPAFVGYIVAGDPDPDTSLAVAKAMIDAGAALLEIGVPFSDPMADGVTIQRAHERALRSGVRTEEVFSLVRAIRAYSALPIVLFTYYNILYRQGPERFVARLRDAGADGLLIVDLPFEESEEIARMAALCDIDLIRLIAPTTSPERRRLILARASGFVYLIAVEGVTGVRERLPEHLTDLVDVVLQEAFIPVCVGFGISRPEHVRAVAEAGAHAVIVGSAIVRLIEEHLGDREGTVRAVREYVAEMTGA
jgi:tryptophan synthase alpha chain